MSRLTGADVLESVWASSGDKDELFCAEFDDEWEETNENAVHQALSHTVTILTAVSLILNLNLNLILCKSPTWDICARGTVSG